MPWPYQNLDEFGQSNLSHRRGLQWASVTHCSDTPWAVKSGAARSGRGVGSGSAVEDGGTVWSALTRIVGKLGPVAGPWHLNLCVSLILITFLPSDPVRFRLVLYFS